MSLNPQDIDARIARRRKQLAEDETLSPQGRAHQLGRFIAKLESEHTATSQQTPTNQIPPPQEDDGFSR
ncbi:MAG: hypothetical protein H6922_04800 [Pseudomonadaceae bacterium]|nr:hypothetical protein [Pseudomonadaceae bacterium]